MKIEVNITKTRFFVILALVLVLGGMIFVLAQSAEIPNPGHSIDEIAGIDTCEEGEVLTHSDDGIECVSLSGLDSCYWTGISTGNTCQAFCDDGDIVISGGGTKTAGDSKDDIQNTRPILGSPQGWEVSGWADGECRAFCCKTS